MKKIAIFSLVLILVAVSAVPVMAAGGPSNGHGNGNSAGQGNAGGNQDQTRDRDKDKIQNRDRIANSGAGGQGNSEHTRMRTPFYLQGTITAIDAAAKTLTVTLTHGNARVKEYIGTNLTLQASDGTLIYQLTQGGDGSDDSATSSTSDNGTPAKIAITFAELAQLPVGLKVAIHGNLVDGVYNARLITVYIRTPLSQESGEQP